MKKKIINKKDFTFALRRLISRYIAGSRQETDVKSDLELNLYIGKNEFWSKEIADNDEKDNELFIICPKEIMIGNAWDLYNVLDGDNILNKIIDKDKKKENENEKKEEIKEEHEISTASNIKPEEPNVEIPHVEIPEEEEEPEERDDF